MDGQRRDGKRDVDFSKARGTIGRYSEKGRAKARAAMRARATLSMLGGLGVHALGLALIAFGSSVVPTSASSVLAFLGLVMVGFGLAYYLASR